MRKRLVLIFFILLSAISFAKASETLRNVGDSPLLAVDSTRMPTDTVIMPTDSLPTDSLSIELQKKRNSVRWIYQLIANGFHINDPGVDYPKFPRFALKVYNWGDRVFNSYDTTYVVSTGKNWKAQFKNHNWMQYYAFLFPHSSQLRLHSDLYADIGGYVSFMAVSVGYMFNANNLLAHSDAKRTNFNFNFTCALFTIDYTHQTAEGGAKITHVGEIFKGHDVSIPFDDMSSNFTSLIGYYMFNHRRYSHAAAYCYSKYQLRSAGSWILGLNYFNQNTLMDFSNLDPDLFKPIPDLQKSYHFNYTDYMVVGGYGKNWVPRPRRWLINLTTLLGAGYKRSKYDATDSERDMIALQARLTASLVYNHRSLFAALNTKFVTSFYFNGQYTLLNALLNAEATVGFRF